MSRHLSAVPDPDGHRETFAGFVDRVLEATGLPARVGHPSTFRRPTLTLLGELAVEAPGWWVCPTCDRRVDRGEEGTRTVTGRVCTGPAMPSRPRHAPVSMMVQR